MERIERKYKCEDGHEFVLKEFDVFNPKKCGCDECKNPEAKLTLVGA